MKLPFIMILICMHAVSAYDELDTMVVHFSHTFLLSIEKVRNCVSKTRVTADDIYTFSRSFDNDDQKPDSEESQRRATCFLACITQEKGLMIGSKLQMTKVHDEINREIVDDERKPVLHAAADSCVGVVENMSDECQVALQFIKCMIKKVQTNQRRA